VLPDVLQGRHPPAGHSTGGRRGHVFHDPEVVSEVLREEARGDDGAVHRASELRHEEGLEALVREVLLRLRRTVIRRARVVSCLVLLVFPARGAPPETAPCAAMVAAARAFLDALDAPRRAKAALAFDAEARLTFSYLPGSRAGLSFKDMSEP